MATFNGGDTIAYLGGDTIAYLDHLMSRKQDIEAAIGLRLTERGLFILLFAAEHPVGAPEIRVALRAMRGSRFHAALRRMHHWLPFYNEAKRLEDAKALVRMERDRRVFYRPHRAIKATLKSALASVPRAA